MFIFSNYIHDSSLLSNTRNVYAWFIYIIRFYYTQYNNDDDEVKVQ